MQGMDKRAGIELGFGFVAKLILGLFFMAAATMMVKDLAMGTSEGYDKDLCKISVVVNSKGRIGGVEMYKGNDLFDVKCPTRYVTISPDKYVIESGSSKGVSKNIRAGDLGSVEGRKRFFSTVNMLIANQLFDCWDQFARGKVRVFSSYTSDRQCLICSRIEFKGVPSFNTLSLDNGEHSLEKLLKEETIENRGIKYFDFIFDETDYVAHRGSIYEYSTDVPMAIVFSAMNKHYVTVMLRQAWDTVKSLFVEDKEGNRIEFVNALDFLPYDEVAQECQVLR